MGAKPGATTLRFRMSTLATKFLEKKGIPFEVIKYEHKQKGAVFASEAIRFPQERTIKTLVVDLGPKGYGLVLVPGNRKLDLKRLARSLSVKKAAMADTSTAERLTGYLVGGISPFGAKQDLAVVMEEDLLQFDKVAINGGRRGLMLLMDPRDISRAIDCEHLEVTTR